jgi:hypothetical protein
MTVIDQPEKYDPIQQPKKPCDWLQEIDTDSSKHHFVGVVQLPAPGHGDQIMHLVATCTCGWRSAEHQLYLGASASWAKDRACCSLKTRASPISAC